MKISLESLDAVSPSTYNPRSADPKRLDVIELSLQKLGFLAPIFADTDGEILSGHQRHLVATRMGATKLPVFRTKAIPLNQRKALNIVFNRATNDFDFHSTPGKVTRELESLDLESLAPQALHVPGGRLVLAPGRLGQLEDVPVPGRELAHVPGDPGSRGRLGRGVHRSTPSAT